MATVELPCPEKIVIFLMDYFYFLECHIICRQDVVIENTCEEQDVKHISEVSTSVSKTVFFFSVISHSMHTPAISLSPNKMLA